MRLGVYTDYCYARKAGTLCAEQSFSIFVAGLGDRVGRLVLIGRLDPDAALARHPLPPETAFVALPHYRNLATVTAVLRAGIGSLRRFWRALDSLDAVWLLGPHPLSIVFALAARARGRAVYLGVRQDLPLYTRRRHPGRRGLHLAASALEAAFRMLARAFPTIVVGPTLARNYAGAAALLETSISLVPRAELATLDEALARDYRGELRLLSVGRLGAEKNPLMLADLLARLRADQPERWRLTVCGDGPQEAALDARLAELDVADGAWLRGYVPDGDEIRAAYRESHFLVLTSWTEAIPQVVVEALAAGLPVVATDVGGIREAMGEAVTLIAPGDDAAAARELRRLADDPAARRHLVEEGLDYAAAHTLEHELDRVAGFLAR